jgi:hypothetical protein
MRLTEFTETRAFEIDYGHDVEEAISKLDAVIRRYPVITDSFPVRWLAIKLLEEDHEVQKRLLAFEGGPAVLTYAQISIHHLAELYEEDVDAILANRRYGWIHSLVKESLHKSNSDRFTTSDKIDRIVTQRHLGVPIFLGRVQVNGRSVRTLSRLDRKRAQRPNYQVDCIIVGNYRSGRYLGGESAGRWHRGRRRRCPGLHTRFDVPLPGSGCPGRFRLHGPRGICHGLAYEPNWLAWQKFPAVDGRIWLLRTGHLCDSYARKREGSDSDWPAGALYELWRAPTRIRAFCSHLFSATRGRCGLWTLCAWNSYRDHAGHHP